MNPDDIFLRNRAVYVQFLTSYWCPYYRFMFRAIFYRKRNVKNENETRRTRICCSGQKNRSFHVSLFSGLLFNCSSVSSAVFCARRPTASAPGSFIVAALALIPSIFGAGLPRRRRAAPIALSGDNEARPTS